MPTRGHEANATLMPSASSRAPGSASSGPAGTPAPLTTHPCTTPANAFQREELTQGTEEPTRPAAGTTRLPLLIYVLAAGVFLMGTTEFIVAGILPQIATDIGVGVADAGL